MKLKYEKPAAEVLYLLSIRHMLESSYVPIGEKGGFDVKQHQGNWEINWDGTYETNEDADNQNYPF